VFDHTTKGAALNMNDAGGYFRVARKILNVSFPLMGAMLGNLIMMLVDRICLARYSSDTLVASGPAIHTAMAIVTFFTAFAGFSRSCVAQAFGRSGQGQAAYQAAIGILVGAALAIILLLMAPLLELIPFLSSRPMSSTRLESQFLYWSAYFGAAMTLNMALSSYFSGIGRTRVTLVVGLIGQLVSIFMIIGLVFGKYGLPELGMRGSAIGTLSGTLIMLACYLFYMPGEVWGHLKRLLLKRDGAMGSELLARLRKGFTIGGSAGITNLGSAAFVWIIAGLGAIGLAANNINLTVNYIGGVPLIGLGIGCSVLCGNALGEGDYPQIPRILFVTMAIELSYAAFIAFFQIVTPMLLLNPFGLVDKPEEIRQVSIATSRVLWVYTVGFAFSMTGGAVLESFGLTRFLFATRVVLMWALSIPVTYMITAAHIGNASFLPTCWIVGSLFEASIGAMYFWRIWRAVRKRQNDIVLAQPATP
jgi:MATE family multidrug resistance protein